MGRVILISGANGSGKSRFAEELIAGMEGRRYYAATMVAQTEENRRRIEKHRLQRAGLDFTTVELPYTVGELAVEPDAVVLLEDVSNLLSNNMFERGTGADTVFRDICALAERCSTLVIVTISGLRAGDYEGETAAYINALTQLNERLYERADTAVSMEDGVPVYRKGVAGGGPA